MTDDMAPCVFQLFFCQSFDSVAFCCHPSTCCEDKGIAWRLVCVNHSVVVFILLLFFMWLVDLCQGLCRIGLWGRMCDSYVKESFLAAIPQSSHRDIQPCIVSSVDFSFMVIFIDWQNWEVWVHSHLNIPTGITLNRVTAGRAGWRTVLPNEKQEFSVDWRATIRDIWSLQIHTKYLTFSLKKPCINWKNTCKMQEDFVNLSWSTLN